MTINDRATGKLKMMKTNGKNAKGLANNVANPISSCTNGGVIR